MKQLLLIFTISLLVGTLMTACSKEKPADLVLTGGRIYTMDQNGTVAEAIAVRGDTIVAVGAAGDIAAFKGPGTKVIDLAGRTVIPGLTDAHAHLFGLGRSLAELDLVGTASPGEICNMVLARQQTAAEGEWISGRGWDQNDWEAKEFPSWRDLAGTEDNPVYLRRVDGHALWVNKTAMDLAGISSATPDTAGGKIIRDNNGEPTGVFIDNAIELVKRHKPADTREEKLAWIKLAMAECNRYGLTGVHDAGNTALELSVYDELAKEGNLTMRIYAMLDGEKAELLEAWYERGPFADPTHFFTVRAVKLYADGALGSRGAALLEPYSDAPGETGLMVRSKEELLGITREAIAHGFQVCTHAIGDAGVRMMLDIYEQALAGNPVEDPRLRIEHAQVVAPGDFARFAKLGIIPSMQPTHATSDMDWAERRLGPERIRGAYAWRTFLDQGSRIPCGSDFPVERCNPFLGIYAAVTRQDRDGNPRGGWYPEQRMTLEEAVRGFTFDAAYAQFAENSKGRLAPGMLADMLVLDRNIFEIQPSGIPGTKVLYTIVGGTVVYKDKEPH